MNQDDSERVELAQPNHWLAYELHDGLLQWILSARMSVETIVAKLDAASNSSNVEWQQKLGGVRQLLDAAGEEGRQLIQFLEQPVGGEVDLLGKIKAFVDSQALQLEENAQELVFPPEQEWPELDPRLSWNLLRIVQQAIQNAMRHAGTCRIYVASDCSSQGWSVQIRDDGKGFDTAQVPPAGHFGLASMRHRAQLIGAKIEFLSQSGKGTTVTLQSVPTEKTVSGVGLSN